MSRRRWTGSSPLDPAVFEALALPARPSRPRSCRVWGRRWRAIGRSFVLVLDDLHVIDNPACLDAIATLATHLHDGSQLVLSRAVSRRCPLGAARARGLAIESGPDELRSSATEPRKLLRAAGLNPPTSEIAELTEQTEGWPAGLYLAALSTRARAANGSHHVLRRATAGSPTTSRPSCSRTWPRPSFTSSPAPPYCDRLTGPLCDAVLQRHDSMAMLESLAHSNLFLVPARRKPRVLSLPPPLRRAAALRTRRDRARARI